MMVSAYFLKIIQGTEDIGKGQVQGMRRKE